MSGDDENFEKDFHGRRVVRTYFTEISGAVTEAVKCNECDGSGTERVDGSVMNALFGAPVRYYPCRECKGKGYSEHSFIDAETARGLRIRNQLSKED